MNNPVLKNSAGELCCSWCGSLITGHAWRSGAVRGYYCGESCRASSMADPDYSALYPRVKVAS